MKGKISILFSENGLRIEIQDPLSGISFVEAKLNTKQTCQALSRPCYIDCELDVGGLDVVGKKREHKEFVFEMPEADYESRGKVAIATANALLKNNPEGWVPQNYYGAKDSFFTKDGKSYARTLILRWVPVTEDKQGE